LIKIMLLLPLVSAPPGAHTYYSERADLVALEHLGHPAG